MADIIVNDTKSINGSFSVSVELDSDARPPVMIVKGSFQTGEYVEEITKLESARYIIKDVKVLFEAFGSDDDIIIYHYTAKSLIVKQINPGGE